MKKILLAILSLSLLLSFLGLSVHYSVLYAVDKCTGLDSFEPNPRYYGLFYGEVQDVEKDTANRLNVVTIGLCGGMVSKLLKIKAHIPDAGFVSIYEVSDDLTSLSGEKYSITSEFQNKIKENKSWTFRGDEFFSLEEFSKIETNYSDDVKCDDVSFCYGPTNFKNKHEAQYNKFMDNLENRKTFLLFKDFLSGGAVIYGSDFIKTSSKEKFIDYVSNNTI